ncbi:MATH domain-containing protein [Ditylenchus destructor]|uniref:MATH domain-containing protein n=1 Tax=Ditylenchus destructor TaxID=166010 RepID=A0AAD4QSN0_9BILA|nr:MATH domain-containing protein [Ditylenchus destructor]
MSEEGTLELRIDRFTEFIRSGIFSSSQEMDINGLPWKIGILTPTYTYPTLNITLQCNEGHNKHWECTANVTFHIVSQKEGVQDIVRRLDHCFYKRGDPAYLEIKHPDVLFDPDNGFIKDDTVILRAHVKVGTLQTANFTSSISDPPDGVLIVGTNRIPIHKTVCIWNKDDP